MNRRLIGYLALGCLVTTELWLVFLIAGQASAGALTRFDQVLAYVGGQGALFLVTYANATLVTLTALGLFGALHVHLRAAAPSWSGVGIVFVPVYGAMNLCVYLSQITIVPQVMELHSMPQYREMSEFLLRQLIQAWPESAVFIVNNLGYAVLGIPSLIFGALLFGSSSTLERAAGISLALSGSASIAGFIGITLRVGWLSQGSLAGGVLFLLALVPLAWAFLSAPKHDLAAG